jgi:hypothetical protein
MCGADVVTSDPDALFARAVAHGAKVLQELYDTDYGSRDFAVEGPEGNRWTFGTYPGAPPLITGKPSTPARESASERAAPITSADGSPGRRDPRARRSLSIPSVANPAPQAEEMLADRR